MLWSKRINNFNKWEAVEIRIPGTNPPDAMLSHENGRVSVVEEIAGKIGKLGDDLASHISMTLCGRENSKAWRGEQRRHKVPRR
jgi:hypothetical protein